MKHICPDCLRKHAEAGPCPHCGKEAPKVVDELAIRSTVQRLHKKANVYRERISAGLSFLVIGITALIIGAIFFRLSYKLDHSVIDETIYILVTSSAEFFVAMCGLVGGGVSTLYGLVWSVTWAFKRRIILHDIDEMRETNSFEVSRTPTIFEIWWAKLVYAVRQTIFVLGGRKSKEAKGK